VTVPASPARTLTLVVKSVVHTVLLPGTVLVGLPMLVVSQTPDIAPFRTGAIARWLLVVAVLLGIGGAAKLSWDFIALGDGTPNPLDPPKRLVVSSLYRLVRNPGYLVLFGILLSEALFFGSTNLLLYTLAVVAALHTFVVRVEEPGLRVRFGAEYDRFCAEVPRWIPRLRPWYPAGE
jgi:protein-S-isoprenylcysteine O-methyltransferase Ste14